MSQISEIRSFAIIGVAGYIAPRHLKAVAETGNKIIAAYDPSDSVGVLDQYFPQTSFFTEFERFDRHLAKLLLAGERLDYLIICSPNYLHDAHIRYGLRLGVQVICEKPLVLKPWNLDALTALEGQYKTRVFSILQLRLHPNVIAFKEKLSAKSTSAYEVDLTYITPRGKWYYASWKGDEEKSGGIITNIGIHLFDLLIWLFGTPRKIVKYQFTHDRAGGYLEFEHAKVRWFLSINADLLPQQELPHQPIRRLSVNGDLIDVSDGFGQLHTESYKSILDNTGFGIADVRPSIELIHQIREATISSLDAYAPSYCYESLSKHPFR